MRKVFAYILQIVGWGCVAWFGIVGGGFSAIYLLGFIGTGGREAGGELFGVLIITAVGIMIGFVFAKLGKRLLDYEKKYENN
jgi:hypothetical protein